MNDLTLRDLILQHVPEDGSSIGNKTLLHQINPAEGLLIPDTDFRRIRDELIAEGFLASGKGRGGSVFRVLPAENEATHPENDEEEADEAFLAMQEIPEATPTKPRAASKPKAGVSRANKDDAKQVISYRHDDKRKNNPQVGMVDTTSDGVEEKKRWAYDPHIDPILNFDTARAGLENLIDDALSSNDPEIMRGALEQLKRMQTPYLNWTGKAERTSFDVDTVSLHAHERIDPASILAVVQNRLQSQSAKRKTTAFQPDLFSTPFENLPLREAIDFYKHERDWANRLIAGDSLLVMNSLLQKESMAGRVQMIYIDPPYGIKYGSNFQPFTNKRDVKDRDDSDLTQEPEQIRAFRDTWELGIHSYLTYLRDRLLLAKDLLADSGSIFVQISDENVHLIRNLLDEIFGIDNFITQIVYVTTSTQGSGLLPVINDNILWYCVNKELATNKFKMLYDMKELGISGSSGYSYITLPSGLDKRSSNITQEETKLCRYFAASDLTSSHYSLSEPIKFQSSIFTPNSRYWSTSTSGIYRIGKSGRLLAVGNSLRYKRYFDDFSAFPKSNVWTDTGVAGFTSTRKVYAVQTNEKVIERCILMTTDPGDLVLDPTCGSGTTAYVAEKWGRRWITCDTSRIAVTLAKQRLMTASYDYYELKYPQEGLRGGFIYKTVPHITLKSIANNQEIDEIYERMHPAIEQALAALNQSLETPNSPLKTNNPKLETNNSKLPTLQNWEIPFNFPEDWPETARECFDAFHAARLAMQQQMDGSIKAHADMEILYDQAAISKTKLRISGPFTVEAVPFATVLGLNEAENPANADVAVARSGETSRQAQWRDELLKTGIRGKNGQLLKLADLDTVPSLRYIHAVGVVAETGERVAVSFGPEYAALEQRQVEIAMREAGELFPLPKMLVFCAFNFDPEAAKDIDTIKGITALKVQMNTDLLTEDLKKGRPNNQSFWLMGQPDVEVISGEFLSISFGQQEMRLCRYDGFKKLSGFDSLAEIHGFSGEDLFFYAILSQGRAVWDYLADAQSWNFHTGEYSGGPSTKPHGGIPPFSWDSQRLIGGIGDLDYALREAGLSGLAPFKELIGKLRRNPETPRRLAKIAQTLNFPLSQLITQNSQLKTQNLKLITLYQVEVHGFDYFDTQSGELKSGGKNKIALWSLDTDYDDRSLFPKQVFFPMSGAKDGWDKLKKDIKAELDIDLLAQFKGTVSIPFGAGKNRRIAVKIVDDRGIESLRVMDLD